MVECPGWRRSKSGSFADGNDRKTTGRGAWRSASKRLKLSSCRWSGYTQRFASNLFDRCGRDITVLTETEAIPRGAFDAVVCLDVLEHVPDPPAFVGEICRYMKPDARLLVHAPFYMIHPDYPTHLLANRKYAGSLEPYTANGLKLLDGEPGWNPIVVGRGDTEALVRPGASRRRRLVRLAGRYLAMGRCCTAPVMPLHWYRAMRRRWFESNG